jgi:hypothetical protein
VLAIHSWHSNQHRRATHLNHSIEGRGVNAKRLPPDRRFRQEAVAKRRGTA